MSVLLVYAENNAAILGLLWIAGFVVVRADNDPALRYDGRGIGFLCRWESTT